jgi:hypothetical protein
MKTHHMLLYIIKISILILIALVSVKIIPVKKEIYVITDFVFKFLLGIFIIYFFLTSKLNIDRHDKLIFILAGFILILLVDYIDLIKIIHGNKI